MKTPRILSCVMSAAILALLGACQMGEITRVPAKIYIAGADELGRGTVTVSSKAQTTQITFTANGDWRVLIPQDVKDWISVKPESGKTSGEEEIQVEVSVKENTDSEDRNAILSFICDKLEQKAQFFISQSRFYTMNVSSNKSIINKDGGEIIFTVNANSDWTYSINDAGKLWLSVADLSDTQLIVAAKPLENATATKTAEISFLSSADPDLSFTFTVQQKDIDLSLSAAEMYVYRTGASALVEVSTTNVNDWIPSSDCDWVSATKSGTDKIEINVSAITSGDADRIATVSVTAADDDAVVAKLSVAQLGKEAPVADLFDVEFSADGTARDISKSARSIQNFNLPDNPNGEFKVAMNDTYGVHSARFVNAPKGGGFAYYTFTIDDALKTAMDDGYSMECICSYNIAHDGSETKAFSSTKGGGTAIMLGSGARDNLLFLINVPNAGTTTSSWKFVESGVKPEIGRLYHVVGTWDIKTGIAAVYIDGELKGEVKDLARPWKWGTLNPNYFTIGANENSANATNAGWYGEIPVARIYDNALSAEEVKALYLKAFAGKMLIK